MDSFVGREAEIKKLNSIMELRSASLVVVNGRRRIGKSRLIREFATPYKFYKFNGLAPREGITPQDQRNEFMRKYTEYFGVALSGVNDWGTLFGLLAQNVMRGRIIILFDEISWMAEGDPDFLGKLKNAWDDHFSRNAELMLFLCGSVSTWIEKNLLSSTAYLGRPTLTMRLGELQLPDCMRFWDGYGADISVYEKLKLLAITGGVPRYLELINPRLTAEENINNLYFSKESALYEEFKYIFNDIYGKRSAIYQTIVSQLVSGSKTQEEISGGLGKVRSGDLSEQLNDLIMGGFVKRDVIWQVNTGKMSNLSKYRLTDNYLRFALKYILPNKPLIEKDRFLGRSLRSLPGWDAIMGLQFENLVVNNHKQLIKLLGLNESDIIFDNPFFQRKTKRMPGCQIDYMIQTRHDTVFVCEIKFRREKMGAGIIEEMQEKLDRLKLPKHISKRAVLIHVNGVKDSVIDSLFFTRIIGFDEFLKEER